MDQHHEDEIARGLHAGSTDAWRELYDAHAERVWRLVARVMAPHAAEVGDVVQETFLAAARGARGYDPARGSLWSWLSGIARRQAALHCRRETRGAVPGGPPPFRTTGDGFPLAAESRELSPPEALAGAELAGRIRAVLTQLPVDYETLLCAKYIDEATAGEIAAAEQSTLEAVRSKLARARRAFRRIYDRQFPDSHQAPDRASHES